MFGKTIVYTMLKYVLIKSKLAEISVCHKLNSQYVSFQLGD